LKVVRVKLKTGSAGPIWSFSISSGVGRRASTVCWAKENWKKYFSRNTC